METLCYIDFKKHTMQLIQQLISLSNGSDGQKFIMDSLGRGILYTYHKIDDRSMTIADLLAFNKYEHIWLDGSGMDKIITSDVIPAHITNITKEYCFLLDEETYEAKREDILDFLSTKIPLVSYENPFSVEQDIDYSIPSNLITIGINSMKQLIHEDMIRQMKGIRHSLQLDSLIFSIFDSDINFTKDELVFGKCQTLLSVELFDRFCCMEHINKDTANDTSGDILRTFTKFILKLMFNTIVTWEQFENVYLRCNIEDFMNYELKIYCELGVHAASSQEIYKLNYIKEGLYKAADCIWHTNLSPLFQTSLTEQTMNQLALLNTSEVDPQEEYRILKKLLAADLSNRYVLNYIFGVHSKHITKLKEILKVFKISVPCETDIKRTFFLPVIPLEHRVFSMCGVLEYFDTLSLEELKTLQSQVQIALHKYGYKSHRISTAIEIQIMIQEEAI